MSYLINLTLIVTNTSLIHSDTDSKMWWITGQTISVTASLLLLMTVIKFNKRSFVHIVHVLYKLHIIYILYNLLVVLAPNTKFTQQIAIDLKSMFFEFETTANYQSQGTKCMMMPVAVFFYDCKFVMPFSLSVLANQ